MGDKTPDWDVEVMRLELQILDIQRNVMAGKVRLKEQEGERARTLENEEASHRAIAELKERIKGMRERGKSDEGTG